MFQLQRFIGILKARDRPGRFLISRLLWRSRLCLLFKIYRDGFAIRFRPSVLSADLWIQPDARAVDEEIFRRYLRDGDCVVDVGANIGLVTLLAASLVGSPGCVYAFEPHPRIFRYLRKNVAMNHFGNVRLFNMALGDCAGSISFSDARTDDQNAVLPSGKGISVPVHPLDEITIPQPIIHLLKIDTEGYEKFVLLGASKILERTALVHFESRRCSSYGYDPRGVTRLLSDAGFQVFKLDGHAVQSLPEDYISEEVEDLVAVREPQDFLERIGNPGGL